MPYLAPAYLKGYLDYFSDVKCKVFDLNNEFYINVIGGNELKVRKEKLSNHIRKGDICSAVNDSIGLEEFCQEKLSSIEDSKYKFSLKKITTTYNQYFSANILKELAITSKLERYLETIIKETDLTDYNVFGITISVEDQIIPSFIISKIIKKFHIKSTIILGGSIPTRLTNEIASTGLSQFADYIIKHEGELSLLNLMSFLTDGKQTFISNDPKIVDLGKNDSIHENDTIAFKNQKTVNIDHAKFFPNFEDLKLDNYLAPNLIIPLNITRRCYWAKCDFCSIYYTWDPKHRVKSIDNVISEIKHQVKKHNVQYFRIVDDSIPPKVLYELAHSLINNKIGIYYEIYSRFETKFLSQNFCDILYKSGCRQIFFGLENIGTRTLNLVNKGKHITETNINQILENTFDAGISNYLFLLFGIPQAPVADEELTVEYIINNKKISTVAIGTFLVDRFSPIHLDPKVRIKYKISLYDKGDMTTEFGYKYKGKVIFSDNKNRTKMYLKSIFSKRPDLAISSLLNEETRLILASTFGNTFLNKYMRIATPENISTIIAHAVEKTASERIYRQLS